MNDVAIRVENLSKRYFIGQVKTQNYTLQERLGQAITAPFRRVSGLLRGHATAAADLSEEYWALNDVSFDIQRGEVVAIVGRNGAGKSTLLKVLSRVTEPTSGNAEIRGRVGTLLEVGTGFHPELTGRENVFLNGSIIGMRRAEVQAKFDEIVEFSEIGQFIDTPIKHYSSGMRVRLAFSVAAHLEPEVLFVDEVLAVGDAAFRKKCMEKVRSVGENGATVLLVSHNAQAVTSMCQRAIWLQQGQLIKDGSAPEVVAEYLSQSVGLTSSKVWDDDEESGGDIARLHAVRVCDNEGRPTDAVDVRDSFLVEADVEVFQPGYGLMVKFDVFNSEAGGVFSSIDAESDIWNGGSWPVGMHRVRMRVPGNFLQLDTYPIGVMLWAWTPNREPQYGLRDAVCVHIVDEKDGPSAIRDFTTGQFVGPIRPMMSWERETLDGVPDALMKRVQGS